MTRKVTRKGLLCAALGAATALAPGLVPSARAESLDKIGKRLVTYEGEVRTLAGGIKRPSELGLSDRRGRDLPTRRTIEAQVNFGVGNYDDAAIVLYDVVERYPKHKIYDEALYYLAESLFMKGDHVASRTYFARLVDERGSSSRFYQQSLERLIELTLKTGDAEGVDRWLTLLDQVPQKERRSSVPYVRGKYAFHSGNFDEAMQQFAQVGARSPYHFQARYFIGASLVAKKDLARAVVELQKLVRLPAKTAEQKRVVELAYMALGRIHYERNQPSRAIDRYLEISRKSDLFDESMYEVAWVYVKNKEFDKALRALELLALNDPNSTRLPSVKILEGNLRIRKAQRLGETAATQASRDEYAAAVRAFDSLRQIFSHPRAELERVIGEKRDPSDYLAQVTGRHAETFDIKATLPEVAAAWLREEPEVQRIVLVEADLGQVEGDIEVAEKTIYRLEQALLTPSRVNIFPELADKRIRATEIQDDIQRMRIDLTGQLHGMLGSSAELDRLRGERERIASQLAGLPDASADESVRVTRAIGRAVAIDKEAAEAATIIGTAEAQLVAMEKFLQDQGYKEVKAGDLKEIKAEIDLHRAEIEQMKKELEGIRGDVLLARDRAGTGDDASVRRRALRADLRAALDAEHRAQLTMVARLDGSARSKANEIAALIRRADGIEARLDQANNKIEAIVEEALTDVRTVLAAEKAKLAAYKREYTNYDGESHALGGEVLGMAFVAVSSKLYEVLMRSDVGVVDVAWSVKESADRALRRLTLDQAREARTLDVDFADVVQEVREKRERELRQEAEQNRAGGEQEGTR